MSYLYIDTSSSYLYAGIVVNDKLICEVKKNLGTQMSNQALFEISKLFDLANLKPQNIDKIIVVSGPGSFTGIRIGMTIAKIYAWALKKEITTITSLDAMAVSGDEGCLCVPIIDARREYVYAGIYKNKEVVLKNQYIKLENLINILKDKNEKFKYIASNNKLDLGEYVEYNPNILKIVEQYKDKKCMNPHSIEPEYLKLTEAEENLKGI